MIHVYVCKGGSKNPRKTGQPGFLSLLKCVRQHMWHLLGSNLQSSAVTHDWNSALQTLRVTIWSCRHIWAANKVHWTVETWHIRCYAFLHTRLSWCGTPKWHTLWKPQKECIAGYTRIQAIHFPSEAAAATTPASTFFARVKFLAIDTAKQTTCLKHGRNKFETRVSQISSHVPLSRFFFGWKWMIFYVGFCIDKTCNKHSTMKAAQLLDRDHVNAVEYNICLYLI